MVEVEGGGQWRGEGWARRPHPYEMVEVEAAAGAGRGGGHHAVERGDGAETLSDEA
jgi:hypothetical protein